MAQQLFLAAKQKGASAARALRTVSLGLAATAATTLPAFAATAQPDVTEVVAYILAAVATVSLVGNASLLVKVATAVFAWIKGAVR